MLDVPLNADELAVLQHTLEAGTPVQQNRAQAILYAAEGKTVREIASLVSLTSGQITYWLRRFGTERTDIFAPVESIATTSAAKPIKRPEITASRKGKPDISPDDPMSEAGRKVMAYYLARLLHHEQSVRHGEQTEAIHDMRVASRRLRSALEIFGSYYKQRPLKSIRKNLRRVAKTLGAVRDLEVVLNHAYVYAQDLEPALQMSLQPLLAHWQSQLDEARQQLLEELDSQRYANFLQDFAEFVNTPDLGAIPLDNTAPKPYFVRHIVPVLVYQRYEFTRAFGPVFSGASLDTIHALRIEAKGLRYTLEAFESILAPEAKQVIEATKALQERLGALQDSRVTANMIRQFISDANESDPLAGILQYLTKCEAEKKQALESLPTDWAAFENSDVRQALNQAVAVL